jgi:hypothetical protein
MMDKPWVKGTIPKTTASFSLSTEATAAPDKDDPAGGGTCTSGTCTSPSIDFPVTTAWTQVLVKWDGLTPGTANGTTVATTGKDVFGLTWTVGAKYVAGTGDAGYVPSPGTYDLSIDNVQFLGATACDGGQKVCGTGCVDSTTDNNNCGTCGNVCKDSRTCSAGSCVCLSGSKYLNSIEAGTEVFLGTGRLDTDQYYCTLQ